MTGAAGDESIAEIIRSDFLMDFPPGYVVETEVFPYTRNGGAYINPRYHDVNNKYECVLDYEHGNATLNKVVNGTWSSLQTVRFATPASTASYRLKTVVLREGSTNRLQVWVDDVMYIDHTDASLFYKGLSFLGYDFDVAFDLAFDSFRVRQYAPNEPAVFLRQPETRTPSSP